MVLCTSSNRITSIRNSRDFMLNDLLKKADQTPKNQEHFHVPLRNFLRLSDKHQESIDENIQWSEIKLE